MTPAEQIRSDVLDALERLKSVHHALADGEHHRALVHLDVAQVQLGDVRGRLADLAAREPLRRDPPLSA